MATLQAFIDPTADAALVQFWNDAVGKSKSKDAIGGKSKEMIADMIRCWREFPETDHPPRFFLRREKTVLSKKLPTKTITEVIVQPKSEEEMKRYDAFERRTINLFRKMASHDSKKPAFGTPAFRAWQQLYLLLSRLLQPLLQLTRMVLLHPGIPASRIATKIFSPTRSSKRENPPEKCAICECSSNADNVDGDNGQRDADEDGAASTGDLTNGAGGGGGADGTDGAGRARGVAGGRGGGAAAAAGSSDDSDYADDSDRDFVVDDDDDDDGGAAAAHGTAGKKKEGKKKRKEKKKKKKRPLIRLPEDICTAGEKFACRGSHFVHRDCLDVFVQDGLKDCPECAAILSRFDLGDATVPPIESTCKRYKLRPSPKLSFLLSHVQAIPETDKIIVFSTYGPTLPPPPTHIAL